VVIGQRAKWLLIGLFILWTFFVLVSFFVVQKPFSATNALAVGNVLLDLLTAIWLALVALGMGTWFLGWLLPSPPSRLSTGREVGGLETLVLGAGLGLGMLGLLSLGLGLLGLFRSAVAYGLTLALSAIFAPQLVRLFRHWRHGRPLDSTSLLPTNLLSTIYCLLILLWTSLLALLPPTDWDGIFYHLTGPKLYLQAGRIVSGIDIPHLNFPSLMEMLYAWAMLLRGDIAAKLLHTFFGLLLGGLIYLTARCFLNKKAGWLAVVAFASMPMVSTLAGWAYNDLALAFYQLATLYTFIKYQTPNVKYQIGESGNQGIRESGNQGIGKYPTPALRAGASVPNTQHPIPKGHDASNRRWLVLSGIFAGLAMGLKYTGFVTPVVVGGLILWHAYRVSRFTSHGDADLSHRDADLSHVSRFTGFVDFAIFSLSALLLALPWYAKNWAFTGNPVYPFLSSWLDGRYWDSFRADWYAAAGSGIGWRPGTLLALPWLMTLGVRDVNYWDGRTGSLFLLFLPLILLYGLFRYRRNAPDRPFALDPLLIYALAQFGFWTLGAVWSRSLWQSRLFLPGLVTLAPVVGWLWADLPRFDLPRFSLSRFVNLTIGLALALTLVDVGLLTLKINPLPYLTGGETRDEYLTRRLGAHYAVMGQINETLPPDAVIVFLWEPRSYFCQRDCRPDSILDKFPHLVYRYGSAKAITYAWRQARVTHVLIHRAGLNFILNESLETVDTAVLAELEAQYLRLLFETTGAYQVYALEPAP
jgi:hypothetical protein